MYTINIKPSGEYSTLNHGNEYLNAEDIVDGVGTQYRLVNLAADLDIALQLVDPSPADPANEFASAIAAAFGYPNKTFHHEDH